MMTPAAPFPPPTSPNSKPHPHPQKDPTDEPLLNTSHSSPLFNLPLELRRHIYTYVLVADRQPLCHMGRPDRDELHNATALLAPSHEMHSEALRFSSQTTRFLSMAHSLTTNGSRALIPKTSNGFETSLEAMPEAFLDNESHRDCV